jgi:menaquinone-dependent protoporphyrinogen IX oxidase
VKQHRAELSRLPVAYFCTAMSLTTLPGSTEFAALVYLDPMLVKEPKKPNRPSFKERYTLVGNYLKPILGSVPDVKPVSVAFFGGRLELFRLKFLQMLFVMVIIGAQPGDMRNWTAIQEWAEQFAEKIANGSK